MVRKPDIFLATYAIIFHNDRLNIHYYNGLGAWMKKPLSARGETERYHDLAESYETYSEYHPERVTSRKNIALPRLYSLVWGRRNISNLLQTQTGPFF